ncbi:14165_t:CDS:2 [Dentiscutata erythropus]|uniref:14165_t:CDS:1 n=1 Tax=Dentiscutata erythropus TaxID=1348616 RepID=A0A9N9HSR8_9GLOM|nr:14165_t:CDS:2 [Dentiscutata erythropus]
MPRLTNRKQRSKKASEAKEQKNSIKNSDDSNNASYDEAVENNNATGIVKRLQARTKKYNNNTNLEDYDDDNLFAHNKRKRQQQRKAAKGTPMLHTFWNQEKSVEKADEVELSDNKDQLEEVDEDDDIGGPSEDEIEILLDIKKENPTSEDWLVKNNHKEMKASEMRQEKGFLWDKDILLQIKSYAHENKWNITSHMIILQMNEVILPGLGFAPPPTILLNYYIPELRGEAKGLKKVLGERGLWPEEGLRVKEAQELMSQQPNFLAQKG